jgi:hypothetical protein
VKELKRENKHLRKELKALKNLIYSLPEFRRDDNVSTKIHPAQSRQVKIKKEPGQDDNVVILETPVNPKENIVYVIDDAVILQARDTVQASEEEATQAGGEEEAEQAIEAEASEAEEDAQDSEADEDAEEEEESIEAEEDAEEQPGEEDSGEVFEITIAGKAYYTTNEKNGKIYAVDADEEVGDEIGAFVNGKPVFNKPAKK